jgi:hypothetical protein
MTTKKNRHSSSRTKKIYDIRGGGSIIIDPRITAATKTKKYSKDDYHSNNGMMTTVWGPPTWHMLHCISFNYPVHPTTNDQRNYTRFIKTLKCILPCGKCRKNLDKNFKILPLEKKHMASRDTFSKYIYDLHEIVNHMLGKSSGLTYDDVRSTYEHFRAKCTADSNILNENVEKSKKNTKENGGNVSKETGCVVPFNGRKQKCILQIKSI